MKLSNELKRVLNAQSSKTKIAKLRNKPDAQKEIRDIAATMLDLVKNIEGNPFKYTIEAFGH
jgi:thymidylate synthase ThyX